MTVRGKFLIHFFFLPLGCLFADKIFQCRQLKRTILCSSMIVAGRLYITKKKRKKNDPKAEL